MRQQLSPSPPNLTETCSQRAISRYNRLRENLVRRIAGTRTGLLVPETEADLFDKDDSKLSAFMTFVLEFAGTHRNLVKADPDSGRQVQPKAAGMAASDFRYVQDKGFEGIRPLGSYFTSLWTLQEICLRPDKNFATWDWKIKSQSDGTRIPIHGFITLWNSEELEKSRTYIH
ncbi:hypothetical protein XA68_12493 [Ophiocordyceps unilateralis]|uniref:Uncharacterized protein n=1 Tax=Ophiocordyceps unilateralis TaxID=268505 RepID=A0A2A9PEA9_OPHUN|nr:hypothetical protein XA68_12493 [Ophiocordyceps unilateralis]